MLTTVMRRRVGYSLENVQLPAGASPQVAALCVHSTTRTASAKTPVCKHLELADSSLKSLKYIRTNCSTFSIITDSLEALRNMRLRAFSIDKKYGYYDSVRNNKCLSIFSNIFTSAPNISSKYIVPINSSSGRISLVSTITLSGAIDHSVYSPTKHLVPMHQIVADHTDYIQTISLLHEVDNVHQSKPQPVRRCNEVSSDKEEEPLHVSATDDSELKFSLKPETDEEKFVEKLFLDKNLEHRTVAYVDPSGETNWAVPYPDYFVPPEPIIVPAATEIRLVRLLKLLRADKNQPCIHRQPLASGNGGISPKGYGLFLGLIQDFLVIWLPYYTYAPEIEVLLDVLGQYKVIDRESYSYDKYRLYMGVPDEPGIRFLDKVVADTQIILQSTDFKKKLAWNDAIARRINRQFTRIFNRLLKRHKRVIVGRLDLEYLAEFSHTTADPLSSPSFPNEILIERFISDRDRFSNNLRDKYRKKDPRVEHLLGWAWKMEFGEKRGWHLHCIFWFDARKVRDGYFYLESLGKYWADVITEGKGTYHNCNRNVGDYKDCCLGLVKEGDLKARAGFTNLVNYLSLHDQMPIVKRSKKMRNFGVTCFDRIKARSKGHKDDL